MVGGACIEYDEKAKKKRKRLYSDESLVVHFTVLCSNGISIFRSEKKHCKFSFNTQGSFKNM